MRYDRMGATVLMTIAALAGCSKPQSVEKAAAYDIQPAPAAIKLPGLVATPDEPAAAEPRIAYAYTRQYRLPGDRLATAQTRHVALCDALGPRRCRIVTMQRAAADADYASGTLSLQVDARIARAFADRLDRAVADDGGTISGSGIEAEDLSKDMVDGEARIRAKQALANRLMALLSHRGTNVGELVQAERALATAQEELDAARTWLAEMQARVATSKFDLRYEALSPSGEGWAEPIRRAFSESGGSFAASLGTLIAFVVMALPWAFLLTLLVMLLRRRGWRPRLRFRQRPLPPEA